MRRTPISIPAFFGPTALGAWLLGCAPPPELGPSMATAAGEPGDSTADEGDAGDPDEGAGVALDETRLDRTEGVGACGFPSPGDAGYGGEVGQRLANNDGLRLVGCDGEAVELADFLCERAAGGYSAGILVNIGAGWCGPCQDETLEFPELYEEFHGRGIEIVQVLFQDWTAQAPTRAFCEDWSAGRWLVGDDASKEDVGVRIEFPVVLDQTGDWTARYLQDPESATPVNMLLDANGNIRWKAEGQKPDLATLRAQLELVLADPYGA